MRAWGDWPPAARAVVTVAATCLFVVLVAWATRLGPDEVFTGPGPRPATMTTPTESCTPLAVATDPDGTTRVEYPADYQVGANYCEPPAADVDDYRDIVEQNPPPLWLTVLVRVFLGTLLVVVAAGVVWLAAAAARALASRPRAERRAAVDLAVLDEPAGIAGQVMADAQEQDVLLREGDPRNAIVAAWHRFEVQGERAGVPRRASETSSEYALRILDLAEADTGPVARLAELYREARFSDHPITEEHRSDALAALASVRRSLGVRG